ncbi:myosin-binding protein H-like isoform X5 [Felis catus]|uniref:myosin-binding protein H-like isoform X5 n=1 Tax=Felis catus TaxID=9685 RepID=UPI001D19B0BC|nr:myosin-binding protein H-like isoform X5 [Felis catus]
MAGTPEARLESRCLAPPSPPTVKISLWSPASGRPSMEAATAPEVASSGSTLKVKETSPADAEGPPASPRQEASSPIPQLLSPIEEHPKIWLPRALRQTYIRKVGDTVNLLIPFQGKPKPQATWTHDGCALDAGRVSVRNGERDSILFIREAQRADSGRYQLSVRLGELEATATIDILVIATLRKTGGFAQRDFSEAPKFTQPLADCTTVMGYDTQLFCCVRASPKPKIIWLKNKMDIQGNPKYRALTHLGICSLEIRKPGPFDGGIYTCKAVNPLGEASVDCRVDVRGKGRTHTLSPQLENSGAEPQACMEKGLVGFPFTCSRHWAPSSSGCI